MAVWDRAAKQCVLVLKQIYNNVYVMLGYCTFVIRTRLDFALSNMNLLE